MARRKHIQPAIGRKVGRLLVLSRESSERWLCQCDCGVIKVVWSGVLSCGCLKREATVARNTSHGKSGTPEYHSWSAMRQRCYNPKTIGWAIYGGKGVRVCERWRTSFANFFADMGLKPSPTHTLDRIDGCGHYEPGNVRWADRFTQSANRSNNINVLLDTGETVCLEAAARHFGADYGAVRYAVHKMREFPLDACKRLGAAKASRLLSPCD